MTQQPGAPLARPHSPHLAAPGLIRFDSPGRMEAVANQGPPMAKRKKIDGIVYSTDVGQTCPECGKAIKQCLCAGKSSTPAIAGDGVVRVHYSTKGRGGKAVTCIIGIPLAGAELKAFAKDLKRTCGAGGAIKDGVVEIQGDQRDRVLTLLKKEGWSVKRSGG